MKPESSQSKNPLGEIKFEMKSGQEKFFNQSSNPNIDVLNFWQWSNSDLLTNTTRGILAEFLVASSLDVIKEPRIVWDNYDLIMKSGVKIEVKSAAKYQTWKQSKSSLISFTIKEKYEWNEETEDFSSDPFRPAEIYVFCVLNETNPLNLDNWDFYVLLTENINERCGNQKTISLTSLRNQFPELKKCRFNELHSAIKIAESSVLRCRGNSTRSI